MPEGDIVITQEIAPLPRRSEDAHKGDAGRVLVIGGCHTEIAMIGAPALVANAALRSGAGLVHAVVPDELRPALITIAPCATTRKLAADLETLLQIIQEYEADVVAMGPGLGTSLTPMVVGDLLVHTSVPVVVDADGLNRLAEAPGKSLPSPERIVLTPHPGEIRRLLSSRGRDVEVGRSPASRKDAALALAELYRCVVVLKGRGTIVTNGQRLYINETGNAGLATGGTGDVLTGVIAGLIAQGMETFEASILGVFLHGLAGDFASEEMGRHSMTATDVIEYLPEAFAEHEMSTGE